MATRNLRVVPQVMPPAPLPQSQGPIPSPAGWVWDGANWVCNQPPAPCQPWPCPPPCPPCTDEFPPMPPGCPPWYPPPSGQAPWYPGANGGVTFSQDAPSCPTRGHFWFDGKVLWLFDGAAWVDVGLAGISTLFQTGSSPVFIGSTAPPAAAPGALWWNGTVLQLWDGVKWNVIGPSAAPAGGAGLIEMNYYLVSQTISIPAIATMAAVRMWGATGGSGGIAANQVSGGSGAGGYLEKFLTGLVGGNTMIFTSGAGGAAGASGGGNGGNGGITTLVGGTQIMPALTCNGSVGTSSDVYTFSPGGTAVGGDFNMTGQSGGGVSGGGGGDSSTGAVTFYSVGANGVGGGPTFPATAGNPGNPGGCVIGWYR